MVIADQGSTAMPEAVQQTPAPAPAVEIDFAESAKLIRALLRRGTAHIVEAGRELDRVKKCLGHGRFRSWIDENFGMSMRTAQLAMRLADWAEGRSEIISHLEPTGAYLLSSRSAPQEAVGKITDRIKAGDVPTTKEIGEALRDARQQEKEQQQQQCQRRARSAAFGDVAKILRQALRDEFEQVIAALAPEAEKGASLSDLLAALADAPGPTSGEDVVREAAIH
jgi:Protein of unknown function (DUF3102)